MRIAWECRPVAAIRCSLLLVLFMALVLSSCFRQDPGIVPGSEPGSRGGGDGAGKAAQGETPPLSPGQQPGKYDPPIELTSVRSIDSTFRFLPGESIHHNIWTQAYEEELGIRLKYDWVVDISRYQQRLNVMLTSGELPDMIPVDIRQLQRLVDAGLIMDLSSVFEEHASPLTKQTLLQDGGVSMRSGTFDGKLMGIPNPNADVDQADLLWVRQDWLERLGLPEPATMDDVLLISQAFAKLDPDNNGLHDTYGLGVNKQFLRDGGIGNLTGFFNGYHAYPSIFIRDSSGQLVYGSIQPEMKPALARLQQLFMDGQLDREFGLKDWTTIGKDIIAGKIGMFYGKMWNPNNPLNDMRSAFPSVEWKPYPIVSIDDAPALATGGLLTQDSMVGQQAKIYYTVRKDAAHPEAIIKMLNLYTEKAFGEAAEPEQYLLRPDGINTSKYALVAATPAMKNLQAHRRLLHALEHGDITGLTPEERSKFESMVLFRNGNGGGWASNKVFGEGGSFSVIDLYVREQRILMNGYNGVPTPTMMEKSASLLALEMQTLWKIIMGAAPLEEFDLFVEEWKRLGGETITNEVNEAARLEREQSEVVWLEQASSVHER